MEFEWNIFPGFNTLQLSEVDVQRHLVDQETKKKNAKPMLNSFLCMQKDLEEGQWSFIGPGSEKKWYSISEDGPQGDWDNMAERMLLEFDESGCPISVLRLRPTQKQRTRKTVDTFSCGSWNS